MPAARWVKDYVVQLVPGDEIEMTMFNDEEANAKFSVEATFLDRVEDKTIRSPYNNMLLNIEWPEDE